MPEIKEYLPEVGSPGPQGSATPNLEAVSQEGHALARFGQTIETAGTEVHTALSRAEVSDVYGQLSQLRAKKTVELQKGAQDGSLDMNKLMDDYDEQASKISDQYSTGAGSNTFNRQSERLRAALLISGSKASAAIHGKQAAVEWQDNLEADKVSVGADPSQYGDLVHKASEYASELAKMHGLNGDQEKQLVADYNYQLASTMLDSVAQSGAPLENEPGTTGTKKAQAMLESGLLDGAFSQDQKLAAQKMITTAVHGAESQKSLASRYDNDQLQLKQEAFNAQAVPKLFSNSLQPKEVLKALSDKTIDSSTAEKWLNKIKTQSKDLNKSHPDVYFPIIKQTMLPDSDPNKIFNMDQVMKQYPDLSGGDLQKVQAALGHSQSSKDMNLMRLKTLHLGDELSRDPLTGQHYPGGATRSAQWADDLLAKESEYRNSNPPKDPKSLYDSHSPDWFGNKLDSYRPTPQQVNDARMGAFRGNDAPTTNMDYTPGTNPMKDKAVTQPENKRKAGESPIDFLKRMKTKGP